MDRMMHERNDRGSRIQWWSWSSVMMMAVWAIALFVRLSEGLSVSKLEVTTGQCDVLPRQLASREAAALLRDYYNRSNDDRDEGLVLITSDASSHGANRHVGLASFIRQISSASCDEHDKVWVQYKRQQKLKETHSGELSAIMLGVKKLLREEQVWLQDGPVSVWILTDCQAAMDFFLTFGDSTNTRFASSTTTANNLIKLGNKPKRNKQKKNKKSTTTILQDSYRRYVSTLLQKSSQVCLVKVRSTHSHEMGFLDHTLADLLSRSTITGIECTSANHHDDFCHVPPLQNEPDILWLGKSQDDKEDIVHVPHHAVRKRASGDRIEQCKQILLQQFQINVNKE